VEMVNTTKHKRTSPGAPTSEDEDEGGEEKMGRGARTRAKVCQMLHPSGVDKLNNHNL